jgi:hypothetical protein
MNSSPNCQTCLALVGFTKPSASSWTPIASCAGDAFLDRVEGSDQPVRADVARVNEVEAGGTSARDSSSLSRMMTSVNAVR